MLSTAADGTDDFLDMLSTADNGIDDLLVLSIMIIDKGHG